jgi:hypothetical protein
MILSLSPRRWSCAPAFVPQRRRAIVLGATEAGVAAAFHLGVQAMVLEQRDVPGTTPPANRDAAKRWQLPQLTRDDSSSTGTWTDLLAAVRTVTRAETRLGARVTAIDSIEHRLFISSGESFVYDKLIATLRIPDLQRLIVDEKPARIYSAESWRYWLIDRDIELLDQATQQFWGDIDGQAAGKRVAETVYRAITAKYSTQKDSGPAPLFQPRIVSG